MSEALALTRLAISRSRTPALCLIAIIVIGTSIGAMLELILRDGTRTDLPWLGVLMVWSFLPAGFATFVLFDFSSGKSVGLIDSNCDRFILRSPIQSWKIAMVPLVLKTLWISILWLIFVTFIRYATAEPVPRLIPCFAFSAVAIWAMAVAWRPMQWPWLRFVILPFAAVASYGVLILYVNSLNIQFVRWRLAAFWFSTIFTIVNFVFAAFAALRAIELARTSPDGIIPAVAKRSTGAKAKWWSYWMDGADQRRDFTRPIRALAWYEFAGTRDRLTRTITWMVIPSILLLTLVFPLHAVSVTFAVVGFAVWGGVAVSGANMVDTEGSSMLSPFLGPIPMTDAAIAWTRFAVSIAMMMAIFSCLSIVFVGWSAWPSNRQIWFEWALTQAESLGGRDQWFSIGVRLSTMIVVTVSAAILGSTAGLAWTSMAGRDWLAIAVVAGVTIVGLGMVGWFAMWFARQTDWDTTMAKLREMSHWIAPVIITMLVAKAVAATWVAVALVRANFASTGAAALITIGWLLPVALVGTVLAFCNPFAAIQTWHCVAFAIWVFPLSGILGMPIAMSYNRHR
ncbi:hypothetical protein Poly51_20690 [Rubripirellula tenax]|uniref:Uncharacterized protein n=1 Tax=Rubripirellula tenax TaxID=2528015 RepID=A0A5C6FEV5_9BACT|nr:hypothetical protein [Rubripirellula tenax]TWU59282.1 hypothetical protein Poly51_20690 [Rubripirellula tenax]